MIKLTETQKELITNFYSHEPAKVVFNKNARDNLWEKATKRINSIDFNAIKRICPALEHQIKRSYKSGNNIQPAVFSECVYSQTLANMLGLPLFVNCLEDDSAIPLNVIELLKKDNLSPRYAYLSSDRERILIQAGGCNGIDSALITMHDLNIYKIEFKEPGAKTSEPDLPKYKEDGVLLVTEKFLNKYPQFGPMLNEQVGLNFFEVMGSNINNFSKESINIAISKNYTKKYADVICTEDVNGYLVMMPVNDVPLWAEIEGEIRPSGRNHYKVWTPDSLHRFLINAGASFNKGNVTLHKAPLDTRKERGGAGRISGYKINPIFFIPIKNCIENNGEITFDIKNVRQLKPTIAGKMFFKNLKYSTLNDYYKKLLA